MRSGKSALEIMRDFLEADDGFLLKTT